MRVTPGAAGKITLNWIPKFNPHTFFSSTARDATTFVSPTLTVPRIYEQFPENVTLILNISPDTHLHR
jgi:hypothetical protein